MYLFKKWNYLNLWHPTFSHTEGWQNVLRCTCQCLGHRTLSWTLLVKEYDTNTPKNVIFGGKLII